MRRVRSASRRALARLTAALFAAAMLAATSCGGDGPASLSGTGRVQVRFVSPATVRSVIVRVTGPGIAGEIAANIPVDAQGAGSVQLEVPAGGARRFVLTAVDTFRLTTHRADTTLDVRGGPGTLAVRLEPVMATVGTTVTNFAPNFGLFFWNESPHRSISLGWPDTTISRPPPADGLTFTVGEVVPFLITNTYDPRAQLAVPMDLIAIASSNPGVVTIERGYGQRVAATARRVGDAEISMSYGGRGFRLPIHVRAIDECSDLIDIPHVERRSGVYPLVGAQQGLTEAYCDLQTDGGGWTRVLGVQVATTWNSPWEVTFAAESAGLALASRSAGAISPQAAGALMQRIGATEMRWRCLKPSVGRTFHIKTADPAVIAYYTGASDVMPSAPGTFTPLAGDFSTLAQNPARWGRVGTTYETGTWGHEAIARADRFILAGPFIKELAHWTLFQSRFECDDYNPGVNRQGTWEIFVR